MKIRIGVALGAHSGESAAFVETVRRMEADRFDSLWLSEVLTTGVLDPLSGLAYAAAVTRKLKLGTTLTVTSRNPVRLAKELATIDRLSGGRLLLVFVPGLSDPLENQALVVPVKQRGAWLDEVLPLVRALWSGEPVAHRGSQLCFDGVSVAPRPVQDPLEVWLGGTAKSALLRAGRLSEGWLPSLITPAEAAAGRATIEAAAAQAGRRIDPEHFGVSLSYALDGISPSQVARVAKRRPGLDPTEVIPVGYAGLRELLQRYIDVGFSKFVVRPTETPAAWPDELDRLADGVLGLQT